VPLKLSGSTIEHGSVFMGPGPLLPSPPLGKEKCAVSGGSAWHEALEA